MKYIQQHKLLQPAKLKKKKQQERILEPSEENVPMFLVG